MTPTAINRQPMLVAVGASAGGLEALTQLLRAAPEGTGMTFVVVQHLSPDYKSMMVELLDRRTTLTVKKAEDGLVPEAEHAYVIEPQTTIRLDGDVLRIEATERKERVPQPINFFFESMAANREGGCVGIVLSGTGSDGARGCEAIKDAGGTVIVQDPGSAAFDGMPSAAIRTGSADLVLAPELMIQEMMSLHEAGPATYFGLSGEHGSTVLAQLIATLRKQVGVNFTHYKPTTVIRRIQRRMQHLGFEDPRAYGERLRGDEAECAALYHDLLIGVTRFHRDAGAVEALQSAAIPPLLARPATGPIRAWVAGCSTGEEAYTVSMLLTDAINATGSGRELRVFATDIDANALETASAGEFSEDSVRHLPSELVSRHFTRRGSTYRAQPRLRDSILFSRHNVIEDPPFSRLDFISCRNLLIYLRPAVQQRVVRMFSQCLVDEGVLWLGSSETLGASEKLFQVLESRWRIYSALPGRRRFPVTPLRGRANVRPPPDNRRSTRMLRAVDRALAGYAPPTILITERFEAVYRHGDLSLVQVPSGEVSLDVRDMLPSTLASVVSAGVHRLQSSEDDVIYRQLTGGKGEEARQFDLRLRMLDKSGPETIIALIFERLQVAPSETEVESLSVAGELDAELAQTRQALADTQASLQTTIEELESSNEELQSTNEELIASNEELQSTNEELQSVNEELRMVNDEHQAKVEELAVLNHTLDAVLNGVEVGIVLLDDQSRLSRFNPAATRYLNVRTVDLGRPLAHITHKLDFADMVETIAEVLRTGAIHERYVAADEHDILVRIRSTSRGDATDALLTFTEVTSLLQAQRDATQFRSALALTGLQAAVVKPDGHFLACNAAFAEALERDIEYITRVNLFDIVAESSLDHLRNGLKTAGRGQHWQGIVRVRLTDGRANYLLVNLASYANNGDGPATCLWTARPLSRVLMTDEAFTNDDEAGYWLWDPARDETYSDGKVAELWGSPDVAGSFTMERARGHLSPRAAKDLKEEVESTLEHGSGRVTLEVERESDTRTLVMRLERREIDGRTYLMGETRLREVRSN